MSTPLPERVASAIAGATVTADRNVTVFGADFTPEQLREFSTAIGALARRAETALVHQAGDFFADTNGRGYVSDGVNLWPIGPNSAGADLNYWTRSGVALTVVRNARGVLLGDIIRRALA